MEKSDMALYQIWSEGFIATGQYGLAMLHGEAVGNTFKDACTNFAKCDPEFAKHFDKKRMTYWGCKLFDNEKNAQEFENKYIKDRAFRI